MLDIGLELDHTYHAQYEDRHVIGWYSGTTVNQGVLYHIFEQALVWRTGGKEYQRQPWIGLCEEEIISIKRVASRSHEPGEVKIAPLNFHDLSTLIFTKEN